MLPGNGPLYISVLVKLRFGTSRTTYLKFLPNLSNAYAMARGKDGNSNRRQNDSRFETGGRGAAVNRLEFQNGSAHVCSHR